MSEPPNTYEHLAKVFARIPAARKELPALPTPSEKDKDDGR
jgi:hypothetical protein